MAYFTLCVIPILQRVYDLNNLHSEAGTKWPPYRRRYFHIQIFNENVWISVNISLEFVPKVNIIWNEDG